MPGRAFEMSQNLMTPPLVNLASAAAEPLEVMRAFRMPEKGLMRDDWVALKLHSLHVSLLLQMTTDQLHAGSQDCDWW